MIKLIGMKYKNIYVYKFKIWQLMKLIKVNKIWCLISFYFYEYYQIFIFEFKNFLFIKYKFLGICYFGVIKSQKIFKRKVM